LEPPDPRHQASEEARSETAIQTQERSNRFDVVVIGPLPPPVHGVTIAIERLLAGRFEGFRLHHLDTSDSRDAKTIGKNDLQNYLSAIDSYIRLLVLLVRVRPAIVYVPISQTFIGYARDAVYLILAKALGRPKVIVHLHGGRFWDFYLESNPAARFFIDQSMKLVDRAIVLSDCFKPLFSRWLRAQQIDVVPNGTHTLIDSIDEKTSNFRRRGSRVRRVLYLSSLISTKGIYEFVAAAKCCLAKNPDLTFQIAGEWWDDDLSTKARTLALLGPETADRIQFLGLVTGKAKDDLLRQADLFVLPTYYPHEGQPTVILEAMSAGTPVVATRHASIPEIIEDGVNGILIEKRDVASLSGAILRLANDACLWERIAENAYAHYRERYTTEASNQMLKRSFERALTAR